MSIKPASLAIVPQHLGPSHFQTQLFSTFDMKLLVVAFVGLVGPLVIANEVPIPNADEIDYYENINEEEFEALFDLTPADDPEEEARRAEALKQNEALIKEENELYSEGNRTWFDAVNEFANLPADEFEAEKTEDAEPPAFVRGLIEPTGGFVCHGRKTCFPFSFKIIRFGQAERLCIRAILCQLSHKNEDGSGSDTGLLRFC